MDQLSTFTTFSCFAVPVDPHRDNCPDYFKLIQKPMDFQTVRTNLESDSYPSISSWKADMNLVSTNALTFNPPNSLYHLAAQHLQHVFNSLTSTLSDNEISDWATAFHTARNRIQSFVQTVPAIGSQPPEIQQDFDGKPPSEKVIPASQKDVSASRPHPSSSIKTRPPPTTAKPTKQAKPPAPKPAPVRIKTRPPRRKSKQLTELTTGQESELVNAVNELYDTNDIQQVMELIKSMEPELTGKNGMNLALGEFAPETRIALWNLVAKLRGGG
jgi:hypothetical protein